MPLATLTGTAAERVAEAYLRDQGLRCIERNYRCKLGEIDLVMADGEVLVFVEIRYRAGSDFGSPIETIDAGKRRRVLRTAQHFLQANSRRREPQCRFDVIGVSGQPPATTSVTWIKDAFTA